MGPRLVSAEDLDRAALFVEGDQASMGPRLVSAEDRPRSKLRRRKTLRGLFREVAFLAG